MTVEPPLYTEIMQFWRVAGPKRWFAKDAAFDEVIRSEYEIVHLAAARGEYADWSGTPEGALALVLLLDQFPRNLYRGSAKAFASDPLARRVASAAIAAGHDATFSRDLHVFFYLPFEHSEDAADQDRSVALIGALDLPDYQRFALMHRDLIQRFGRFPHRNAVLGRGNTPEEAAYLAGDGFKG